MTLLRSVFDQIVSAMEAVTKAVGPSTGGTLERGYCPHCGEETEWHVNTLYRFSLCRRCKRNPKLFPSHYDATRPKAQEPDAPQADEPAAEQEGTVGFTVRT